jgi:hypothetical protein
MKQPVTVGKHYIVKLAALFVIDITGLQRLQIKPDGCNRSFKFMRNGVDKRVMLVVSPDLPYEKSRVKDKAGDYSQEKSYAEDEQSYFSNIQDNPSDVQCDCKCNETRPEYNEESNRFATATYTHRDILFAISQKCKQRLTPDSFEAVAMISISNSLNETGRRINLAVIASRSAAENCVAENSQAAFFIILEDCEDSANAISA